MSEDPEILTRILTTARSAINRNFPNPPVDVLPAVETIVTPDAYCVNLENLLSKTNL